MENLVESNFVGWIDITRKAPSLIAINEVVGWNFHTEDSPTEETKLKTIKVSIREYFVCHFRSVESLICARSNTRSDMVDIVSISILTERNLFYSCKS